MCRKQEKYKSDKSINLFIRKIQKITNYYLQGGAFPHEAIAFCLFIYHFFYLGVGRFFYFFSPFFYAFYGEDVVISTGSFLLFFSFPNINKEWFLFFQVPDNSDRFLLRIMTYLLWVVGERVSSKL